MRFKIFLIKICKELNIKDQVYELFYENFTQEPQETISKLLDLVHSSQDKNIGAYLEKKSIYNKKEIFLLSPDLDDEILKIVKKGLK